MTAPHPRTASAGRDLRMLRAAVFAAVCVVLAAAGHTLASCATVPLWTLGAGFLGALAVVVPLAGRARSLPGIVTLLAVGQILLHTVFGLGQLTTGGAGTGTAGSMSGMGSMTGMGSMGGMPALSDTELVTRAAHLMCGVSAASLTPGQAYRILVTAHLYQGGRDTGSMGAMHHPADALTSAGPAASLLPSLPMLLGHILAALAAGWLLRRGDLALLRLIELSVQGVAETTLVRSLRRALALVRALTAGLQAAPTAGPRFRRAAEHPVPAPHTTALQHSVIRRGPPAVTTCVLAA
ncbi:hypothetical protein ACF1B0_11330 [Streptomyces anandii]|uniref:hypothetical protein n=1 Tax=Streptomyces anandii TaxID=285454 RepID=UPI0036FA173A